MTNRKPYVLASFFLALIAVGAGLLAGNRPRLMAAQESGKSPRALLLFAAHPPRMLFATAEDRVGDRDDYPRYLKTQETLIRSRLVLDAALRQQEVSRLPAIKNRTDPITWLQQNMEVTNPNDSQILQISMTPGAGESGADQAAIINAVVRAYMDVVVNADGKRRHERLDNLKKIRGTYTEILNQRRATMRKLAESVGSFDPLRDPERDASAHVYRELQTQRVKLRMERSEVETLLARRKKVETAGPDPAGQIAQLEDRLAVLIAGQKVLDEVLERSTHEMRGRTVQTLDLTANEREIALMEDAAQKVAAEVEAWNVELEAPPRIRLIEEAAPHGP